VNGRLSEQTGSLEAAPPRLFLARYRGIAQARDQCCDEARERARAVRVLRFQDPIFYRYSMLDA
jgi:hypothetical protein